MIYDKYQQSALLRKPSETLLGNSRKEQGKPCFRSWFSTSQAIDMQHGHTAWKVGCSLIMSTSRLIFARILCEKKKRLYYRACVYYNMNLISIRWCGYLSDLKSHLVLYWLKLRHALVWFVCLESLEILLLIHPECFIASCNLNKIITKIFLW